MFRSRSSYRKRVRTLFGIFRLCGKSSCQPDQRHEENWLTVERQIRRYIMDFFQGDGRLLRRYREQIAELNIQVLSESFPQKGFNPVCLNERDYAIVDKMIGHIEAATGYMFVAKEGERICGYCHVYFRQFLDDKCLFIDGLVVHPDFRRQGIGKKLLQMSNDFAVENACDILELFASDDNLPARRLYFADGFSDFRVHMTKRLKKPNTQDSNTSDGGKEVRDSLEEN